MLKQVFFGIAVLIALPAPAPSPAQETRILDVPHVQQKPDFCGEACAEMFLRKLGKEITQDDVYNASGLDPLQGRGCFTAELDKALQTIGFKTGKVWDQVATAKANAELERKWGEIVKDLEKDIPSIACMRYDESPGATEHFRLILGYDPKTEEIIYHEPAEKNGAYRRMKKERFLKLWPLKYEPNRWTAIRLRLEAGAIKETAPRQSFSPADYAQHILALKKKLPGEDFSYVIQPPFVVIGDESKAVVRERTVNTVKWAADRLKADFFKKDTKDILDIWLFKDRESYEKHTHSIFNDRPSTPFGYYSSEKKALIMNIGTGGGTLVHEMVHPFMESNFPECPSWFNEGLASLFEQCGDKDGHIHGQTNWRLEGLQQAIRGGSVPSFESLTGTTTYQFYNSDKGTNYAQARYLCYYLQEKGLLAKYYRQFISNAKDDSTGYETLKSVLDETDMQAFQKRWESFVLKLRFQ